MATPAALEFARFDEETVEGFSVKYPNKNGWLRERNTSAVPFSYICYIATWSEDEEFNDDTGVLIGPNLVLTAGHAVKPFEGWQPVSVMVFPGRSGGSSPFGFANVTKIILFPGYKALRMNEAGQPDWSTAHFETDLALLVLDRDIGQTHGQDPDRTGAGWWGRAPSSNDRFGSSISGLPGWRPGRFRANVSGYPKSKPFQQWRAYDDTLAIGTDARLLYLRHRLEPGHSGSPVWVKRSASHGGRVLTAIFVGFKFLDVNRLQPCARRIDADAADFVVSARPGRRTRGKVIRLVITEDE